jgi:CDP-diacylglycerol---serine O-phosphatidyltransferase
MLTRLAPPDGSRDPRTEGPTNLWLIHPAGRLLLPLALKARISANAVSVAGLLVGIAAAYSFSRWTDWRWATLGLVFCALWLVADGLDGMIARATRTASALGRALDGLCDHGVFFLIYIMVILSLDTSEAWVLGVAAGAVHAIQSNWFEAERARFHRRVKCDFEAKPPPPVRNMLVRVYDTLLGSFDRMAEPFDRAMARLPDASPFAETYGAKAAPVLRFMSPLSSNSRVIILYFACLAGDPRLFWWAELGPLSVIAFAGIFWHRRVEAALVREAAERSTA